MAVTSVEGKSFRRDSGKARSEMFTLSKQLYDLYGGHTTPECWKGGAGWVTKG